MKYTFNLWLVQFYCQSDCQSYSLVQASPEQHVLGFDAGARSDYAL